ncbi:GntR family transcriptional regulator [Ancylobacter sp. WKF20]|uniref:GntR family transcriptional regulator n=1 Tax=Ancylobacter sp. WKF20 TaxID=3039801 RepID=UPI0024344DB2|nr:GntR family transcriptional regulator [Ancylobacter sp. WKF20]WGD29579.1 GntR family transcriptional regulator [Ancylobacter sp. WKF20]
MTEQVVFEKLERDPLHERVHRELRSAIIAARFAPGQKLTVRAISAAFGVSTMPVRAAFARLAAEKAVTALANGTISIPLLTRAQFDELIELRILLEGVATEKAARLITPEAIEALTRIASGLNEAAQANNADGYLQLNQQFKFTVFQAARAPALEDLIERLWLQIGPFMRHYAADIRGQRDTDQYEAVITALRRADGRAARAAMEADVAGGAAFLKRTAVFADAAPAPPSGP